MPMKVAWIGPFEPDRQLLRLLAKSLGSRRFKLVYVKTRPLDMLNSSRLEEIIKKVIRQVEPETIVITTHPEYIEKINIETNRVLVPVTKVEKVFPAKEKEKHLKKLKRLRIVCDNEICIAYKYTSFNTINSQLTTPA